VARRDGPGAPGADPDRALVDRARRGDTSAFEDLVRAHQHRVVNFARALVSDAADAEDVAQEAFLRAYRGLRSFRGTSTFKTWLYQIVTNTARTHLARRRGRLDRPVGDTLAPSAAYREPASEEDVEGGVVTRDEIDRALATLPIEMREAVVLRDVEGLDYTEIAAALGVPIGTVESRIFRGRARMRSALRDAEASRNDAGGSS
jgi:RNA polymerase sigma-70 factor (ECF subfamily)